MIKESDHRDMLDVMGEEKTNKKLTCDIRRRRKRYTDNNN